MYRFTLLVTSFLLLTGGLFAQVNTDSILVLARAVDDLKERSDFLTTASNTFNFSEFDDPVILFRERVKIDKELGNFQREITAVLSLIRATNYAGQFGFADSLSLHYVESAGKVERPYERAWLLHEAASTHFFGQRYEDAIRYDSLALAEVPGVTPPALADSLAAQIHSYLGKAFNASGRFVAAATALSDGLELLTENPGSQQARREMYTELGIVYSQIGLYDQAVNYLDRTTDPMAGSSPVSIAGTQLNIGRNLLLAGDYPAAIQRFQLVFEQELPPGQELIVMPYAYNGLVEAYYRTANPDSLNHYFARFEPVAAEAREAGVNNDFLFQQSEMLHQMVTGQLAAAETTGRQLYESARVSNDPADLLLYTEFLADLYRKQGDYRRADQFGQTLNALQDSVQSANRTDALLLYYNQLETQQKENEILQLEAVQLRTAASRRQFQTVAALLGLLLLTGLFFYLKLRTARRQLVVQNAELTHLNATKDRFFSIIAHDLRNPIVALETADIQVNALLARGKTEAVQQVVGYVSQTAGQLSGLLDNLLQWALGQSGSISLQPESLDLAGIVADNKALYAPTAAGKDISLLSGISPGTRVRADANALHTILRNLVGNAVKFTPAGQAKSIIIDHQKEGRFNILTVRDQGPGISPKDRRQLFQLRGYKENGKRKQGTGLGLVLVRELTELHGGTVDLESKEGEGTVVTVRLPE